MKRDDWNRFDKVGVIKFKPDEEFRTFYPYRDRRGKRLFILTTKRIYEIVEKKVRKFKDKVD